MSTHASYHPTRQSFLCMLFGYSANAFILLSTKCNWKRKRTVYMLVNLYLFGYYQLCQPLYLDDLTRPEYTGFNFESLSNNTRRFFEAPMSIVLCTAYKTITLPRHGRSSGGRGWYEPPWNGPDPPFPEKRR